MVEYGEQVARRLVREVRRGEPDAELLARGGFLSLQPVAGGAGEPRLRAPQDRHATRVGDGPEVLAGDADDRVVVPVTVQVPGRDRLAERVPRLGGARDTARGLAEPRHIARPDAPRRAVLHGHETGTLLATDGRPGRTHQHVLVPVTVEVAVPVIGVRTTRRSGVRGRGGGDPQTGHEKK